MEELKRISLKELKKLLDEINEVMETDDFAIQIIAPDRQEVTTTWVGDRSTPKWWDFRIATTADEHKVFDIYEKRRLMKSNSFTLRSKLDRIKKVLEESK